MAKLRLSRIIEGGFTLDHLWEPQVPLQNKDLLARVRQRKTWQMEEAVTKVEMDES